MLKGGNKAKAWNRSRNTRLLVVVSCLTSFIIVLVFLHLKIARKSNLSFGLQNQRWNSFDSLVQIHPTLGFWNGTDVIWQVPDSPKAVLFLAHGCDGQAFNFWDRSPDCPDCIGLPEERLIVLHALARKFAVVSISSSGRCWSFGKEVMIVKDIIRWWVENQRLEQLPLVALGASSGGHFVSVLATELNFSSITLMIAEGVFDRMDIKENYPPTLFVHMPKDIYRRQKLVENMELLRNKGVDVAEIECMEFPLLPHLLADRIPGIDQSVSAKLFELFQQKGFIDENKYMRKDGRKMRWKEALKEDKTISVDEHLLHPIQEELNLAFAYHEMTSLHTDQIFKWFESHMG
ncbi:Alpha/Beta hydrolase fold containing protein [Trema orientale]|uniref:Alpha/Beta hydrolase fold containing protein n=1 Tax=Trema orientale TaxID=63057 RepID=A0A2P5EYP5_TREOI|nr:Alpha/Beta hydrolase fold containing protein [Trema orientale]